MYAIALLSLVLYTQCFSLLLRLLRIGREWRQLEPARAQVRDYVRGQRSNLQEAFRHERLMLSSMIAAAPLLGLLGTVSGLATVFQCLSASSGQKSMEGLAAGISEVLVATESGLAVAIPAILLVYFAHRLVQRRLRQAAGIEAFGSKHFSQ